VKATRTYSGRGVIWSPGWGYARTAPYLQTGDHTWQRGDHEGTDVSQAPLHSVLGEGLCKRLESPPESTRMEVSWNCSNSRIIPLPMYRPTILLSGGPLAAVSCWDNGTGPSASIVFRSHAIQNLHHPVANIRHIRESHDRNLRLLIFGFLDIVGGSTEIAALAAPAFARVKPALLVITRPHRSRKTQTRCNRCCAPRTHQPQSLLCAFVSACRIVTTRPAHPTQWGGGEPGRVAG